MKQTAELTGSARFIELEERHGAHNYHPLDVVIARADSGVFSVEERVVVEHEAVDDSWRRIQIDVGTSRGTSDNAGSPTGDVISVCPCRNPIERRALTVSFGGPFGGRMVVVHLIGHGKRDECCGLSCP